MGCGWISDCGFVGFVVGGFGQVEFGYQLFDGVFGYFDVFMVQGQLYFVGIVNIVVGGVDVVDVFFEFVIVQFVVVGFLVDVVVVG